MRWTEHQTFSRRNFDMLDRLEMDRREAKSGETWRNLARFQVDTAGSGGLFE
jgi:hypothetical protein